MAIVDGEIRTAILALADARCPDRTFCPSEVARTLAEDWRPLMPAVRRVARELVAVGSIRCTQRGRPVDPVGAKGPIRLGAG